MPVMTHDDAGFQAALRSADLGWLADHLDHATCTLEVHRRLLRHPDARVRHLGLLGLQQRLTARRTVAELRELGALLPRDLGEPVAPESALLLAGLHRDLWSFLPQAELPAWREAALPVPAQIAWLQTEILTRPELLRDEPGSELLLQALRDLSPLVIPAPEALIPNLAARPEPVLQAAALELTRRCLHTCLLSPEQARACLEALLASASPAVVAGALRELAEPWALAPALSLEHLTPLFHGEPAVAEAALLVAARHGHDAVLRGIMGDPTAAPSLRRSALEQVGELATREDIGEILETATSDPLLFGPPALACLRALHRRGHFPAPEHAAAILELALADHTLPADGIAAVTFTCRRAVLDTLRVAPADDVTWPRRLPILTALAAQGSGDLAIGDVVAEKLRESAAPAPFLRAIATLRWSAAEADVIAALPRAPADALDALRAMGGRRTVEALRAGLGLDGSAGMVPFLRAEREWAVALLWHLSEDPADRRALVARLDPRHLPAHITADLGIADDAELGLLQHAVANDTPAAALQALARASDARALPAIAGLLLRITADLAASWEPAAERTRLEVHELRGREGAAFPVMPPEIGEAVRDLGARLHRRRRIRPACLLDATDAHGAGNALFASLLLDLLDRPEPSAPERAILLEALLAAPWRGTLRRVHRLLRHRDPRVRKGAIALLARDGADALSASLTLLTGAGDVQTVRQALVALAGLKARWAAPAIAACLEHPNMNIKKAAAEALAAAGSAEVVPRLLFWLGRHDNPGFRALLEGALQAILGSGYRATLLAAAAATDEDRRRDLLLDALAGQLSAGAVAQVVRQRSRAAPRLLARILGGEIPLASGAHVGELAAEIEALGLPGPEPTATLAPRPGAAEVHALGREGWNEATARRILALPDALDAREVVALAPLLREWLRLGRAEPSLRVAALRLVLRLTRARTPGDLRVLAGHADVILEGMKEASADLRDELLALLEPVVGELSPSAALGVAAEVRALPPAPGARRSAISLLRRAGVLLVRADVEQALSAARIAADPWKAEPAILREAFGETGDRTDDAVAEVTAFRDALRAALPDPDALAALRAAGGGPGSRSRLAALIDAFPTAIGAARAGVLGWMEALQPLGAPPWTLAEARSPRPEHREEPRSAALRARLVARVEAGVATAAATLLSWPEEEAHVPVLDAYLRGVVALGATPALARPLLRLSDEEIAGGDPPDEARRERAARLFAALDPPELDRLFPLLLAWWLRGAPACRGAAARAIGRIAPDVRAEHLLPHLESGHRGMLELLDSTWVLRTPALEAVAERMGAGDTELTAPLHFVDGPLRAPEAGAEDERRLAALRAPAARALATPNPSSSREDLAQLARSGDVEQGRRALTELARSPDAELTSLLLELVGDPRPRIRIHAHRLLRNATDRATYLHASTALLADPLPDVVRSAIRILSFASWLPALPAIVDLLMHTHAGVRRAAAEGLLHSGAAAIPALRTARHRARPDRRQVYDEVLARIALR